MTQQNIIDNFAAIRAVADKVAGEDLPDAEREVVKTLVACGLNLLEGALMDLNRIADALERPR